MPAPAATKWGINGWSESLRQELLPDVWVTVIEPGVLATELPSPITHANTKQGVGTGVRTGRRSRWRGRMSTSQPPGSLTLRSLDLE